MSVSTNVTSSRPQDPIITPIQRYVAWPTIIKACLLVITINNVDRYEVQVLNAMLTPTSAVEQETEYQCNSSLP